MKNYLLLLTAVLAFGSHAASIFTHKISQVPRTHGSCKDLAASLAVDFSTFAAVELYAVTVERESATNCDIQFAYIAEESIPYVETIDKNSFSSEPYQGSYPDQATCQKNLDRERALLENQTGLEAWVSYCYQEDRLLSHQKFVAFVQAIGSSELGLYKASSSVWVRPVPDWNGFGSGLLEELEATGLVTPASLSFDRGVVAGDRELIVRFYSASRRWLRVEGFAEHSDPEVCFSQIDRTRAFLRQATEPPAYAYCGARFGNKFELGMVLLPADILSGPSLKTHEDPKQYASFAECRAALGEVEAFYQQTLNRPVLGGFCGGTSFFRITLFEDVL